MTYDTKFEKAALWIGVKRSGKTTLTWVQEQLAGSDSYVSLSFHNWNRSENSRAGLVGKKVAVFADVRLKPGRAFGHSGYDAGGLDHQSAEYLLNITGRDRQSIGRKYKDDWQGPLTAKIIITSNQPPNLQDAGGVLPSRFIKLEFKQSFDGEKQDPNLRAKLTEELPGIANRCLAAYRRLCARGHFIQPTSGLELESEINALVNPYLAFLSDCYFIDANSGGLTSSNIHDDYLMWCQRNSRFDINHIGYRELMKRLKEVPGEWEKVFGGKPFRPTGNQCTRAGDSAQLGGKANQTD